MPVTAPPAPSNLSTPMPKAPAARADTNHASGRPTLLGSRKQVKELQSSNARLTADVATLRAEAVLLRERIDELRGMDATALEAETQRARRELASVQEHIATEQVRLESLRRETSQAHERLTTSQAQVVQTEDILMLQEVGIYQFRHRLADATSYKSRLDSLRDQIKAAARGDDDAIRCDVNWTVNGSLREGQRMARETAKLMLRAYNAEADNCVRAMRPHRLATSIDRLTKARDTIARLGRTMQIRIAESYHRLRIAELELTADYLVQVDQEKERIRAERERQREEAALQREIERERAKLAKEDAHWAAVQTTMRATGNTDGLAEAEQHRQDIANALDEVETRAANVRAGYVYVISNIGAFGDKMVKIGMTRRLDPTERVRELGDASVPFRFDTHAMIFSTDAVSLETRLHQELADRRVNRVNLRREFFHASPAEVLEVLARVGGQHLLEYTEEPEAAEWRASQTTDDGISGHGTP